MQPELVEVVIGFPPVLPTVFQSVRDNTPLEFELAKIHSFGNVSSYSVYIVTLFLSSF